MSYLLETKVSIPTIAQRLGLARSTVQAALAGTGTVSQATRERVRAAAAELGYQPNLMARAMRTRRTGMVGVVLSSIVSSPYQEMLTLILHRTNDVGYHALFSCTARVPALLDKQVEHFLGIGVEGLIISLDEVRPVEWYQKLAARIPLVLLNAPDFPLAADVVDVDEVEVGRQAAEHLLTCGRRQLAYIPAPGPYRWTALRWAGYRDALAGHGLTAAYLDKHADGPRAAHVDYLSLPMLHGWYIPEVHQILPEQTEHGYRAMATFLNTGAPCDGVLAANDQIAYGALQALADAGRRVPDDVAVIGCDDLFASVLISPSLTTFKLPRAAIGEHAANLLLARLNAGPEDTYQPTTTLLPPSLLVRESSGGVSRQQSPDQ